MTRYDTHLNIDGRIIALDAPTFFIADLASNHNGDIHRARELIFQAKEAGADAVKFQHFLAEKIVSDHGFRNLNRAMGHQANWSKSVFDIYKQYECDRSWTQELVKTAQEVNITFMTTPYDVDALDLLDFHLPAYKIGSGDITWIDFIEQVAQKKKPVLLANGASTMEDTKRAVEAVLKHNRKIALLQCNTNYTGSLENFRYVNLNVLRALAIAYPQMTLGLSDHTPGHAAVLGAIALGARVIEKHFTSDNKLSGPDHAFSMNPQSWRDMIDRSRELEYALGDGIKRIEDNETDTVIVQRRCLRATRPLQAGEILNRKDLEALRPSPEGSIPPYRLEELLGKPILHPKQSGEIISFSDVEGLQC